MPKVVTNNEGVFLEICIPTYNRSRQLERLLTILESEIEATSIDTTIRITVSDNCSPDDTQMMLQSHSFRDKLVVRFNSENIGALRNIWGLYETARAAYVWLLSDDDIPKPGSIHKILDTLFCYEPTVLTFEFEQPVGSNMRRHGDKAGIEEIADLRQGIPHILVLGKLSKQVINARHLETALANMNYLKDTGYGWQAVILETLQLSACRKIVIIHEFLASCDDQFTKLTDGLTPQYWDDQLLLLDHEIVRNYCPDYAETWKRGHPKYMVIMIYGVMAGLIETCNVQIFREYGKQLPFDLTYFRNPPVILEWASLRLGIPAFPVICDIADYLTKIKGKLRDIIKYNA